jgi:hypothetical protein
MRFAPSGSGNLPPTVQITAPADGSVVPPGTITLTATASDPDGTIAQVAFYAGATLLGVDTAGPFTLAWTNVAVGDYTITARALDNAGGSATSVITVHVAGTPVSAPFGGVRAAVPGTIELENFDEGGEGLAYHDTTAGNSGRQYRQTDVDVEFTSDTAGGGYSIGYVAAGEWLAYSVQVAAAGSYTLQARVASTAGNASFHLEVDGVDVTGPIAVPNTGGWQVWQTVTRPGVALVAGPHLMRVVFDSAAPSTGFVGNFNWVSWQRE